MPRLLGATPSHDGTFAHIGSRHGHFTQRIFAPCNGVETLRAKKGVSKTALRSRQPVGMGGEPPTLERHGGNSCCRRFTRQCRGRHDSIRPAGCGTIPKCCEHRLEDQSGRAPRYRLPHVSEYTHECLAAPKEVPLLASAKTIERSFDAAPHGVNTCHGVPLGCAICVCMLPVDVSVSVRSVRIPPYAFVVTLWGGVGVGLAIMPPFVSSSVRFLAHG